MLPIALPALPVIQGHGVRFEEKELHATPDGFYGLLESKLKERALPGVEWERINHREGAGTREYLRVYRGAYNFDIGASPFGEGLFFSWWLVRKPFYAGPFIAGLIYLVMGVFLLSNLYNGIFITNDIVGPLFGFIFFSALVLVAGGAMIAQIGPHVEDRMYDIPHFGLLWAAILNSTHYFRADTAAIFEAHIKRIFEEACEEITSGQGVRSLEREVS